MIDMKEKNIGILAGGCSSEREISLKSGNAVLKALSDKGYNAELIDVRDEEGFFLDGWNKDVAFIAMHGRFGEDGGIQRLLEERKIPYTGSGPAASRVAMDKIATKERLVDNKISTPEYIVIKNADEVTRSGINAPCVVKPQYEGSSVGLTVVFSQDKLNEAIELAKKYQGDILVEKYIPGRELTVGILEDKALPVVEIIPEKSVYDFTAKYKATTTKYVVPAEMDPEAYEKARQMGLLAHKALGCRGFSRVDIRMDPGGGMFVLEVNTIPGLTERSLLPMAAKASGITFDELCLKLLNSAFVK